MQPEKKITKARTIDTMMRHNKTPTETNPNHISKIDNLKLRSVPSVTSLVDKGHTFPSPYVEFL